MKPLRAGAALLTLLSAVAHSQDAPKSKTVMTPKSVTTEKLVMTGMGGDAPAAKKTTLAPKTVTTDKLAMTGMGGDAPAAKKTALAPKTVTTEKLTMTGAGKK